MITFLKKHSTCIIYLMLFVMAILICFPSPTNILFDTCKYTDSGIFTYFSRLISEGGIPYIDSFDHKGPLLYLINYLGYSISHSFGIWFIEIVFWFFTLLFSYKTVNLFFSKIVSLITTLFTYILTVNFFDFGNLTEEFSLLFLTISIFFFVKFLKENKIKNYQIIICGICFGLLLLLRPNNALPLLGFIILIIYYLIKSKQIKKLFTYILLYFIGMILVISPVIIFYLLNDGIKDFFDSYILFNLNYSGSGKFKKIDAFFHFFNRPMFYLIFILYLFTLFNWNKKEIKQNKNIILAFGLSFIFAVIAIVMSDRTYGHYGLIGLPFFVFPLCIFVNTLFEMKNDNILLYIILFLLTSYIIMPSVVDYKDNVKNTRFRSDDAFVYTAKIINDNSGNNDYIAQFGMQNDIYNYSGKLSASYYSFQSSDIFKISGAKERYFNEIKKANIIVDTNKETDKNINEEFLNFINDNNYILIDDKYFKIYKKQN